MFEGSERLVAWAILGAAPALGCRHDVYLGDPISLGDRVVPEGGPGFDSSVDAPSPADAPGDSGPAYPWYLHTLGSKILDSNDAVVQLRGVNWAGMETSTRVPDGLHRRTVESLVAQIEALGFNFIRIPISSESVSPASMPRSFGTDPLAANPDLAGLGSLAILDRIVDAAFRHHLRVILDHYRFQADDQGPPPATWYSGNSPDSPIGRFPESQWIQDWVTLATHYLDKPNMVGCDLHDEPATPSTWGDGNPNTDWRLAAERAGNAILATNPNLVILVEGIDVVNGQTYWAGGNLSAAGSSPVRLTPRNKLVYSIHDYGKSVNNTQPWFASSNYPNNLAPLWDATWGYLVTSDSGAVVVGAFSDREKQPGLPPDLVAADQAWRSALTQYIGANEIGYALWALNPSAEGKTGLLQPDWQTPDPAWSMLLQLKTGP